MFKAGFVPTAVAARLLVAASVGDPLMEYGTGDWPETYGNHRAVVSVDAAAAAVHVSIPWRRRDVAPERKALWVVAAATDERVRNVVCPRLDRELGEIVFEPSAGPGTYYVYYMPYRNEGWWAFPSVVYAPPENSAAPEWLGQHGLTPELLPQGGWRGLPQARAERIEAINEFHRLDPMEAPATSGEMERFLQTVAGESFILFPEDRRHPIRMTDELPVHWVRIPAERRTAFRGEAMCGEFYVFQIGVYAVRGPVEELRLEFSELRSAAGHTIAAEAFRCPNLGGTSCLGEPLHKRVRVDEGRVQALWVGVRVPEDAAPTTYEASVAVSDAGGPPKTVRLALTVLDQQAVDGGDGDLWRHSRLRWLDSTIGLDDEVFAPYIPVRLAGNTVHVLGRRLRFGATGLPESIQSTFSGSVDAVDAPPRELLAHPFRLVVAHAAGSTSHWRAKELASESVGSGAVNWRAASEADGFELDCRAKMECDGYVNCWLTLKATVATAVRDIALEIPFRRDVARYMIGMGHKGGRRPPEWDWKWDISRANNHVWLGDVSAGLQCKLKHTTPHWGLYGLRDVGLYRDWAGDGEGGCSVREEGDAVVLRAFTGPLSLEAGRELHLNFGLLITPLKTLDKDHWSWRYFHKSKAEPVKTVSETRASIINLHQGDGLNPHINYPFRTADRLAAYVDEAHEAGLRVKIYYTVRELSNYTTEFWALRSLGDEIFRHGPGFKLADHGRTPQDPKSLPKMGSSWLCEHAITGYVPAWHQPLGNGHYDAAVAQQGLSRWHNYYLEGLNYLVRRVGIDGLYLDGIGYDRETMKRVRKVMQRAKPGCLIDFHSGNNYHPQYGLNNVAGQYMELFPCLDSLWFGEGFDYDETPDYWLVEISGLPFGLFGEMLQGGGNPWRGMVYGMTNRLGWGGDPRRLWELWDEFGIAQARMIGYWDPACPVRTGRDDVLATAYVRERSMLIAVASWAPESVRCRLELDLTTVGLEPASTRLFAPQVESFQRGGLFDLDAEIPVHPRRGWLLVADDQPHEIPEIESTDPFKGRELLLRDDFGGSALSSAWQRQLSERDGTEVGVRDEAVRVTAAANSVAYIGRPLPPRTAALVCSIEPGTDRGATWGPGLAAVWPDGKALRVNVRAEGRFGVYGHGREILGGVRYPDEPCDLAIVLGDETIRVLTGFSGLQWQALAEIPRTAFPGAPTEVRLGKMGIPTHETDYHIPGPSGACTHRNLRVYGEAVEGR